MALEVARKRFRCAEIEEGCGLSSGEAAAITSNAISRKLGQLRTNWNSDVKDVMPKGMMGRDV
jgi:hypothetical protein